MSFMGLFPSSRERSLAHEEALDALERHGEKAEEILLLKARQSRSTERRMIYRLARAKVRQGQRRGV